MLSLLTVLMLGGTPAAPVAAVGQPAPIITVGQSIAFDYSDQMYQDFVVLRFEVRWDDQATWATINSAPFVDAQTQPGFSSYAVAPPFSNGNHAAYVRACNTVGCGASSDPFLFAYAVASAPPAGFSNFRIK